MRVRFPNFRRKLLGDVFGNRHITLNACHIRCLVSRYELRVTYYVGQYLQTLFILAPTSVDASALSESKAVNPPTTSADYST